MHPSGQTTRVSSVAPKPLKILSAEAVASELQNGPLPHPGLLLLPRGLAVEPSPAQFGLLCPQLCEDQEAGEGHVHTEVVEPCPRTIRSPRDFHLTSAHHRQRNPGQLCEYQGVSWCLCGLPPASQQAGSAQATETSWCPFPKGEECVLGTLLDLGICLRVANLEQIVKAHTFNLSILGG